MIIAAYAGTGKSTFAQRVEGAVDLPIMPYKWILPPTEKSNAELEAEKGARHHLHSPLFPDNYVAKVLRAERESRFVLIPTVFGVVRCLREEYGRKVFLCYPGGNCREEYRARFLARGNSEAFLELFMDGWDYFLEPVRNYEQGIHIVMEPGMYLTDLLRRFEKERQADPMGVVEDETIRAIEKRLADRKKDFALYLSGDDGYCLYPIRDLNAPEERKFLDQIWQMIFENAIDLTVFIASKDFLKTGSLKVFSTENQETVTAFVKRHVGGCP